MSDTRKCPAIGRSLSRRCTWRRIPGLTALTQMCAGASSWAAVTARMVSCPRWKNQPWFQIRWKVQPSRSRCSWRKRSRSRAVAEEWYVAPSHSMASTIWPGRAGCLARSPRSQARQAPPASASASSNLTYRNQATRSVPGRFILRAPKSLISAGQLPFRLIANARTVPAASRAASLLSAPRPATGACLRRGRGSGSTPGGARSVKSRARMGCTYFVLHRPSAVPAQVPAGGGPGLRSAGRDLARDL